MTTPEPKRHAFPNAAFSQGTQLAMTPPMLQQGASDGAIPTGPAPPHFSLPLQTSPGTGIPYGFGPTQPAPGGAGIPFGFEQGSPAGIPFDVPRPIA